MISNFEKYLFEEYGELAKDLIEMGVDNSYKLSTLENSDLEEFNLDSMTKLSYINYSEKFLYPEIDIEKWNIANSHLDKLKRANYSDNDSYSSIKKYFKDNDEYQSFLIWSRNKMDNDKKYGHKKQAKYGHGIVPETPYGSNMPGSSFGQYSNINDLYSNNPINYNDSVTKAMQIKEKIKNNKKNTKSSANRYLKGLAALLQSADDIPWDVYSEAIDCVVTLMKVFKKSYGQSIQASVAHRTANTFDDLGLKKYASDIRKIAQQLEQPEAPQPEAPVAQTEVAPNQPQDAPAQAKEDDFRIPEAEPVDIRSIKTPGPSDDDYNKFMTDDVTVDDATAKLDAVASMLADRRVIRMLAEFDIMLDKLGIASMFPELAESQSKLIDAFSYALTRVSKMMGQLSNAKELIQAAKNLPGEDIQTQTTEEAPAAEVQTPETPPDIAEG